MEKRRTLQKFARPKMVSYYLNLNFFKPENSDIYNI